MADLVEVSRANMRSELEWYFNDADGDLGLRSLHGAMVAMMQSGISSTPRADSSAAEDQAIRALAASTRYRRISECMRSLPLRTQRTLQEAHTRRHWPPQLGRRPKDHAFAAARSRAVRALIGMMGASQWSLTRALEALVLAESERADGLPIDVPSLVRMRVEAWTEAERAVTQANEAYTSARVKQRQTEADERQRRIDAIARRP